MPALVRAVALIASGFWGLGGCAQAPGTAGATGTTGTTSPSSVVTLSPSGAPSAASTEIGAGAPEGGPSGDGSGVDFSVRAVAYGCGRVPITWADTGHDGHTNWQGHQVDLVAVRPGMDPAHTEWVIAHECSHVQQLAVAASLGVPMWSLGARLRPLFGTDDREAIEQSALAMATVKTGRYDGPARAPFTADQLAVAKDLIAGRPPG